MVKFCPNCGEEVSDEIKFCGNCGTEISSEIMELNQEVVQNNMNNNVNDNNLYVIDEKSPGIAVVLSILVWGLGYAYINEWGKFLIYLIVGILLSISIPFLGFTVIILLIVYIYQIYAVYKDTKSFNEQRRLLYQKL